jgi:DICT domain-containing protein
MRDAVARTGVAEATLRMWERRYGFPSPQRLASGHRRYSDRDIELIQGVVAKRAAGLSAKAAISQVLARGTQPQTSIFAVLRRRRPDLEARTLSKPLMLALSRAIEDEALAKGERLILFGAFQRERFYRQSAARWRELSRTAEVAMVFADFPRVRRATDAPAEVPVPRADALNREWALVCEGESFAACLAGWELPEGARGPDRRRRFEAVWSVEPEVVRAASRVCAGIAGAHDPELISGALARLDSAAAAPAESQLGVATSVTARTLARLSG